MKKLLLILAVGVGVYVIWRGVAAQKEMLGNAPKLKQPLPDGAVLTGITTSTVNGRSPDYPDEVVGYGARNWAQAHTADGALIWVETE